MAYAEIRTGTRAEFDLVETKIEPTVNDEDSHVRVVLRIAEDEVAAPAEE